MPFMQVITNVPREKLPENYELKLLDMMSELLERSKEWCMIHLTTVRFLFDFFKKNLSFKM